jgi:hypothetical protein
MNYLDTIQQSRGQLERIGYTEQQFNDILALYSCNTALDSLSPDELSRLADNMKRFVHIARKSHYLMYGYIK